MVDVIGGETINFSQSFSCPDCGISISEIEPRSFSFNNPFGACPVCFGLGYKMEFDPDLMIPDKKLSINEGAIQVMGWQSSKDEGSFTNAVLRALSKEYQFSLDTPIEKLPKDVYDMLIYGTNGREVKVHYKGQRGEGVYPIAFEGIIKNTEKRYRETGSDIMKQEYETFMRITPCKECNGMRLKKESLSVTVCGKNIYEITSMPICDLNEFLQNMELTAQQQIIGKQVLKEIRARVGFLVDVGLDYLSLSRATGSLSGGEAQRIRLATQIGSQLSGVLYVMDEPSIGLHQRDNAKLIQTMKNMRDLGNSLIVVEHDEETMMAADWIVDIGPGAGIHGGNVMASGTPQDVMKVEDSITGQYLAGKKLIPLPEKRRKGNGAFIELRGVEEHNLKKINVKFPLGKLVVVTGVSGSGKSTLVNDVFMKAVLVNLGRAKIHPGKYKSIKGLENIDKLVQIDQQPIGRTPRSNPATYTGVFDDIRDVFAKTPEARMRGYDKGRFSFNTKGGRCEACQGDGVKVIRMNFLPDVYVPCEVCHGKRYNEETLQCTYKGKNIFDVLEMSIEEAASFFSNHPKIKKKLQTLCDVGLGYMKLGQSSTTLSGGEAQRVKLASELQKPATGKTVYILDEPTTGLHTDDVKRLIEVLERIVDNGDTVVVIEHNLDVIKCADYIIDLGPEGGDQGGTVVATGTPEQISKVKESWTGQYLLKALEWTREHQEGKK